MIRVGDIAVEVTRCCCSVSICLTGLLDSKLCSRTLHKPFGKSSMVHCFRIITPLTHPDKPCMRAFISPCSLKPHVSALETEISKSLFTQELGALFSSTSFADYRRVKEAYDLFSLTAKVESEPNTDTIWHPVSVIALVTDHFDMLDNSVNNVCSV